jgi:hypothetical protein
MQIFQGFHSFGTSWLDILNHDVQRFTGKPYVKYIFQDRFWIYYKPFQRMGSELTMRSDLEVSSHFLLYRFETNQR